MSSSTLTRPAPSTKKIISFHLLTGGLYFIVWCNRTGRELSEALRQRAVPSLWWFAVPGGSFYYIWQLSQSLHVATAGRIKSSFTFLAYTIALYAPLSLYPIITFDPSSQSEAAQGVSLLHGILSIFMFTSIVLAHAIYCVIIQDKINAVRRGQSR